MMVDCYAVCMPAARKSKRSRKKVDKQISCSVTFRQQENKRTKVFHEGDYSKEFDVMYPKPRVVFTDIRRSYMNMFVYCMNSGDISLMYGFLDTFFIPDAYRIATKTYKSLLECKRTCEQHGIIEISQHWFSRIHMTPDMSISSRNSRIVCY